MRTRRGPGTILPVGRGLRSTVRRGGAAAAAGLLGALAFAGSASAAAEIGPESILVEGDGARAVIEREPLRIEFQDEGGRTVLSQVANEGAEPHPVPPSPNPEVFSTDFFERPTQYEPLTFMVGASRTVQPCPGNVCGGNQGFGIDAGIEYSARDVLRAEPAGEGVRLEVSTSDPTGRKLEVIVEPGPAGSMRLRAAPTPREGVAMMSDSFTATPTEAFRGFGGRHNAIDQRGHEFYSWPEQENSYSEPGAQLTGEEHYQFPNGPHAAYYPQALFYSSEPYGFLLNQYELAFWRMASDRADAWNVAAVSDRLDYVVAPGEAEEAIKTITDINGRHRVPPEWSVGPMTTRWEATGALDAEEVEAQVRDDIEQIDRYEVPIESYDLYNWALFDRETLRDLIGEFHERGIRVLSYFPAFVDSNEHKVGEPGMLEEALANGYYVKTAAGTPYFITSPLIVGVGVMIDFTNPEAVEWWQERIERNLDLGFDGFMEDFGEQISLDMHFHNGETGATMHNRYPNLYHAATRPVIERYEREHPGREIWNYTRSGYSGTTSEKGSAWGEIANFPGDNSADWSQASGLRSAAPDMLSRGVGGAYGYSTDIGGYLGDTPRELFIRWTEWAALSPYFRLHNSSSNGTRQPWFYPEDPDGDGVPETVEIFNAHARLHMLARPLIMELFREAERTGIPPTRPLWLAFPGDAEAAKQDQQWMLGEDVLVAPVVTEGATTRELYLPAGCWRRGDAEGRPAGETYESEGEYVTVAAPLDSLPYFIRCGTDPFAAEPPDTTPPETEITSPLGVLHPGESAQATFRASEEGASFACAIDSGAFAPCTSPHTVRADEHAPGRHVLRVRATDAARNADPTPAREYFHVAGPRPAQGPAEAQSEGAPPAGAQSADQGTAANEGESAREAKLRRCMRKARAISDRKERREAVRACRERWGA